MKTMKCDINHGLGKLHQLLPLPAERGYVKLFLSLNKHRAMKTYLLLN